MIVTKVGDLLQVKHGVIVHGCNALGVMGSGFALQVKQMYPVVFESYRMYCQKIPDILGTVQILKLTPSLYIVNAITQQSYGHGKQVDYDAVKSCFEEIDAFFKRLHQKERVLLPIMFPLIGAGRGGGDWDIISDIIDISLSDGFEKQLWIL